MSGKYLLDTNIIIALVANDTAVLQRFADASEIFIPCIVVGELYYGARRSNRISENVAQVDELAASNVILDCDLETARHYGRIKDNLRQKGHPVPENDLWIAALALQHDLTLVSRDTHFDHISALNLEAW
jgi:tRNA(fMet)-specific endonuclease VapC